MAVIGFVFIPNISKHCTGALDSEARYSLFILVPGCIVYTVYLRIMAPHSREMSDIKSQT
jgi:hypothetical protein